MRLITKELHFETEICLEGKPVPVTLKHLSQGEVQGLVKKYTKDQFKRGQRFEEVDHKGIYVERFVQVLLAWQGIKDQEGKELTCDEATKKLVAEYNPDFVQAVFEAAEGYAKTLEEKEEEHQGN